MMPRPLRAAPALPLLLLLMMLGACDRSSEAVPPEIARVRQQSDRAACVATELLRRGSDDVASLEETLASTSEGSAAEVTRRAGTAALAFARAYQQHAQLRVTRYARLDSAYNHSPRAADSVRHVEAAQRLAIRQPEPQTVEANVMSTWERDFASLFGDPDHPCNWDFEDGQ